MSPDEHLLELIRDADHSLVRTVDGLTEAAYTEPSLLPGWTRGHVIAHLALNAEALARVLTGVHIGKPERMYDSPEARDTDIDDLAAVPVAELRGRMMASTSSFVRALEAMHEQDWEPRFERTPGGPSFGLATIPLMRVREVAIHHADLDAGYTASEWPDDFAALLLDSMTKRPYADPFTAEATDLGRSWSYGEGAGSAVSSAVVRSVVSGSAADLGWWLTGRGAGEGLTCTDGNLPRIESW